MCGRYYIAIDEKELRDICDAVKREQEEEPEQMEIKFNGEVFPTDIVPVWTRLGYKAMKWGFSGFDSRPVINARSETARTKPMFRESMQLRRCLVPASGYYEWKREGSSKIKHRIYIPGQPMFFAGCYRRETNSQMDSFVILTRVAAGSIEHIHDRMPVIIPKSRAGEWLRDNPDMMGAAHTLDDYLRFTSISLRG